MRSDFEMKLEELQEENEDLRMKSREVIDDNLEIAKKKDDLMFVIENLKADLENTLFDMKVKEDDLNNFRLKFDMLSK